MSAPLDGKILAMVELTRFLWSIQKLEEWNVAFAITSSTAISSKLFPPGFKSQSVKKRYFKNGRFPAMIRRTGKISQLISCFFMNQLRSALISSALLMDFSVLNGADSLWNGSDIYTCKWEHQNMMRIMTTLCVFITLWLNYFSQKVMR